MTPHEHDLVLKRVLDAPPEKVWRAWTDPEILPSWFSPRPWTITQCKLDVRPGGISSFTMRGPDGTDYPNVGVYLEVVPHRRLVTTDAYGPDWTPSAKPFFTAVIDFEDLGDGRTAYTGTARHWTAEDKKAHEEMGFHQGWGQVADQLAERLKTL
jgi:uncharacterized protein YndB with AHSA1/START domain